MTGRVTFGDFIQAAQRHLDPRPGVHGQLPARGNVGEVSQSLLRVISAMERHLRDTTVGLSDVPAHTRPKLDAWSRASIEAREALNTAARFLRRYHPGPRWPAAPAASPLAQRLDGVALSLTTGRDLLHTHFGMDPEGGRQHRSEWAIVITSPAATRALLAEIAILCRRIARPCADLALACLPGERDNADARRALNAACQWLWVLNASVQAAHHREPVTAADRDLLHAIPVNVAPLRCLPDGTESVTALCIGTISTAQRLRHLAWDAAARAPWSPGMSVTGMYEVAAANTATSHNCEVVLQVLAARAAQRGTRPVSEQLSAAADAARHAREAWLGTAHALDHINTDTRGQVSHVAAETRDLTLWTGRLAYANPQWTPASGPAQTPRSPASLAARPGQVPAVMAAVQQVSEALARLAGTEHEQLRAAARAGRILVTTRSLPDEFDIPRPFARAPRERVERLLVHYRDAGQAARQVTAAIGAPDATRAPGHVNDMMLNDCVGAADGSPARDVPGPVERTLRDLGVDSPDVLWRAADLDRASSRLIIDAAGELPPRQRRPKATVLSRSAGSAGLVNHALASGDPRAAVVLRRASPGREPAEREP